jgi:hypothetical protein
MSVNEKPAPSSIGGAGDPPKGAGGREFGACAQKSQIMSIVATSASFFVGAIPALKLPLKAGASRAR